MSDPRWRVKQSAHNINTQNYLNDKNPEFVDWEINTIYYATIHLIDQYFITKHGTLPYDRENRKFLVNTLLQTIYPHFDRLLTYSTTSRYATSYDKITPAERKDAGDAWTAISTFIISRIGT